MIHLDRAGECALETIVLDLREIVLQQGVGRFVPPCDGRAQIGADPAEEGETRRLGRFAAAAVDLLGDRHHVDSVSVVQRHGIAQQRQMPGAQRPAVPFEILHAHALRLQDLYRWPAVLADYGCRPRRPRADLHRRYR